MDFEKIPPAKNVERPRRYSQTLVRNANRCPRSAYLYVKHRDDPWSSHPMMRGTLVHLFAARLMMDLMLRREKSLVAVAEGEDPLNASKQVASLTGAMVEQLADEHPELVLRDVDMEAARICAFHIATGLDVDPQTVVAVERKFLLELEPGRTVSGIIDLAAFPDALTGTVDDYKTTLGVLSQEDYRDSFQTKVYALMLVEGRPVEERACPRGCTAGPGGVSFDSGDERCVECGATGVVEELGEPLGAHLRAIRTREIYPRVALRPNGTMVSRENTITRGQLTEFRGDLLRVIGRLEEGFEHGDWPAVSGSHCTECPSEPECPIPRQARRFAGVVQTVEQAAEALAWTERVSARVEATRREVRNFARAEGEPIPVGDHVYDFETSTGRAIKKSRGEPQWEGLEQAIEQAARYGEPFSIEEWLTNTTRTTFKKRPRAEGDSDGNAGAAGAGDERSDDERWGADVPY